MTKSFLIALAGFAVGLGVTTALLFISPRLEVADQAAGTPVAGPPAVEQRVALSPAPPEVKLYSKSDALPVPLPAARPEIQARSSPPEPAPPPPAAPAVPSAPAALSGPAMPALERAGIAAAPLPGLEGEEVRSAALPPNLRPPKLRLPKSLPPIAQASNAVIAAEARRKEQLEHENVRLANVTAPAVLPPAPPPLPPAETVPREAVTEAAAAAGRAAGPSPGALPRGTWQRYAALTPPIEGRAQVAIVLDDMGLSQFRSDRAIALPRPITLAILPYQPVEKGAIDRVSLDGET